MSKNTYFVIFKKKVVSPKFMSVVIQQWMRSTDEGAAEVTKGGDDVEQSK